MHLEDATHLKGNIPRILLANGRIDPCGLTRAIGDGTFCSRVCLSVMDVIMNKNWFKKDELTDLIIEELKDADISACHNRLECHTRVPMNEPIAKDNSVH